MQKIIMLGTGSGGTIDTYNTCMVIKDEKSNLIVDTGGSVEIVRRLKLVGIGLEDVHNIFITHSHTDHILGLIWLLKKMNRLFMSDREVNLNIYCNDVVYEAIKGVCGFTLPDVLTESILNKVNFIVLNDGDKCNINGIEYEFFDIHAKGTKQFGFECKLNGKKFIYLGDETLKEELKERVREADYVTHEAFCLDAEENKFHAYEKNHSTALSAAKAMNELKVKNIILYHTEETHGVERKELYTKEAQSVFEGHVIVPNDMEEIEIV